MGFRPRYQTLVEIYEAALGNHGPNPLFGTKKADVWEWTTYAQFGSLVDAFRGALSNLGVGKGDKVAVISNNRVEWAVGEFATFGVGAAYSPMYEAQATKEWEYIVRDSEAKVLLVANEAILAKTKGFLDSVPTLKHIVVFDGGPLSANGHSGRVHAYREILATAPKVPMAKPSPDDLACLIYTSGTTGNPKGVMLTHANVANNVSATLFQFPIHSDDRSLSFLPWAHVFGQSVELHTLMAAGSSLAIAESVEKILDNLAEVRPTLLMSVPRIFNRIYTSVQNQLASKPKPVQALVKNALRATAKERDGHRLDLRELAMLKLADRLVFSKVRARFGGRLRFAACGGAAISREVAEFIDSLGITVYEGYGLTETSPIATMNTVGGRRIGSVGRPIPGVRVEIDPKPLEALGGTPGDKEEGEIIVYGHNVMKGYFKLAKETAEVFTEDGGFRTGDMGHFDINGFLYITGRIKEQYKLENGKYVVPSPIEETIKLSRFVSNVMVYGDNRPHNVALIVVNAEVLKEWAASRGLSSTDPKELIKNDQVRALYDEEIKTHTEEIKGFERIRAFALIADEFTCENGMLTPSLKLKRRKVLEVHGALIDSLYEKKGTAAAGAHPSN